MIIYTTANSAEDLNGILDLQKANLVIHLPADEITSQGFVTVVHTYQQLCELNDQENHVVAKDNNKVIGYLLAMTQIARSAIPVLIPMFHQFEKILYKGRSIKDYKYLVVGQVCIDKAYRGQGILDNCYSYYKKKYQGKYDFAITEIAKTNSRSLSAHKRIGFKVVETYTSGNVEWVIVLWDWHS